MVDPAEQVASLIAAGRTPEGARRAVAALVALVEEGAAYVVGQRPAVELVLVAARDFMRGGVHPDETAAVLTTLLRDLAEVERDGEQREITLGWAAWHLGRATLALSRDEQPVAVARARDVVRCVSELMLYEGSPEHAPEGSERARERDELARVVRARVSERVTAALKDFDGPAG